jgi:hypothetical protein
MISTNETKRPQGHGTRGSRLTIDVVIGRLLCGKLDELFDLVPHLALQ